LCRLNLILTGFAQNLSTIDLSQHKLNFEKMSTYIHIRTHLYTHTPKRHIAREFVAIFVCVYVYIHTHIHMYIYILPVSTCKYTNTHVCVCVCACVHFTMICTHAPTHILLFDRHTFTTHNLFFWTCTLHAISFNHMHAYSKGTHIRTGVCVFSVHANTRVYVCYTQTLVCMQVYVHTRASMCVCVCVCVPQQSTWHRSPHI